LVAVRDVSFDLASGQKLGLVGESGSGKTLTSLALMRLLPRGAQVSGQVLLQDGRDVLTMPERDLRAVRGSTVAMIFQNPMGALNPTMRIGDQLTGAMRVHRRQNPDAAESRAIELLAEVGIPDPESNLKAYPHQFSGGMRQRVVIALALSCEPSVIIADEATTALDVTTQAKVIQLLQDVCERRGTAVIFVTHDLALASNFCSDLQVMYAGSVVERAPVESLMAASRHPYSRALLDSVCGQDLDLELPIPSIHGQPPALDALPGGCAFHPRCPFVLDRCRTETPSLQVVGGGQAACHRAHELSLGEDLLPT